jgi:hypothetical protein
LTKKAKGIIDIEDSAEDSAEDCIVVDDRCDSSGGMSPVYVLLMCTRLPLSKRDTLASASEAIKARPCIL